MTPDSELRMFPRRPLIVGSGVAINPALAAKVNTLTEHVNVPDPVQVTFAGGAPAYVALVVVNRWMPDCAWGLNTFRVRGGLFSGKRYSS